MTVRAQREVRAVGIRGFILQTQGVLRQCEARTLRIALWLSAKTRSECLSTFTRRFLSSRPGQALLVA